MKSSATNPCRYITEPQQLQFYTLRRNVKYRIFIPNYDEGMFCVALPTLDSAFLIFVVARNHTSLAGSLDP